MKYVAWPPRAVSGGPDTILNVDFAAQETQDLTPNGDFTVGGLTWTSFGTAGLTGLDIVNGTGLVTTYSATDVGIAAPAGLAVKVGQLPLYKPGAITVVIAELDASSAQSDFNEAGVGLVEPATPTRFMIASKQFVNPNETARVHWQGAVPAGNSFSENETWTAVLAAFIDGRQCIEHWQGSLVSGALPDLHQLTFRLGSAGVFSAANYSNDKFSHPLATPGMLFFTYGTSSNGDTVTVKKFKVVQY